MIFFVTSSLVTMACGGCLSITAATLQVAPADKARPKPIILTQGQRLAADGAFAAAAVAPSHRAAPAAPLAGEVIFPDASNAALVGPVPATPSAAQDAPFNPAWQMPAPAANGARAFVGTSVSGTDTLDAFAAARDAQGRIGPVDTDRSFNAAFAISAFGSETGLPVDVGLAPRVAYTEEGDYRARRVGAEVRIGQNFDQRGEAVGADAWYIFAGADGEALVWEAGEYGFDSFSRALALRDQVTVGDMQAGISVQRGPGQVSLSYIRREVEYNDRNGGLSENEDFAGITFTMKR